MGKATRRRRPFQPAASTSGTTSQKIPQSRNLIISRPAWTAISGTRVKIPGHSRDQETIRS